MSKEIKIDKTEQCTIPSVGNSFEVGTYTLIIMKRLNKYLIQIDHRIEHLKKCIMNLVNRFKIYLFKQLFTENEKCLLTQSLNLQRYEIYKDARCGLSCDYKEDIEDLDRLLEMCENKLWN